MIVSLHMTWETSVRTVWTSVIVWQAWTWPAVEATVSSQRIVGNPETGLTIG
jgi:hypothetical protein